MRTTDIIRQKREGEELSAEELVYMVDGYSRGEIPDFQMAAFLMAAYFSGMSEDEATAMTDYLVRSGDRLDLSGIPGVKVDKHSTGGVGDKTSLIAAPLAAAAGVVVPMISSKTSGFTGNTLDKLEAIPGFRTDLTVDEFRTLLGQHGLAFMQQNQDIAPADERVYALRDLTATVESIPLLASSIMAKKLAAGVDAVIFDVKVGAGAHMKRQLDARRLAQMMITIGRRADTRVQAMITDMNQPLGFAVGNALEIMEVSQTLQNMGPADLTRISLELAARMIHLGKVAKSLDEAREIAQTKLIDLSGYRKFKDVIAAQGGNPQVLDRFELLPNALGAREITTPRGGYVSAINAEDIGRAAAMIGGGREIFSDAVDPAVGVILEVKIGAKVDAGSVLARLYYTAEDRVEEAAEMVEDAFRISNAEPESRELILEMVG
ncbi:MAG: thymidine phosphorylase [Bryobacterales bacterium]|jgi:pyrimidine-nucleoside phosphorylase/thymidine phosphorylase|nr:thymidine phosphorylase [Bryobacterales bacterium]